MLKPGVKIRHLILAHDMMLLDKWDHTACLLASLHNLTIIVVNAASGKSRLKPKSAIHFHPYREKVRSGLKVTPENAAEQLWMFGNLALRNK